MRHPLTKEAFADWCDKQPTDDRYDYYNGRTCAICRYYDVIGLKYEKVGAFDWRDEDGNFHDLPNDIALAVQAIPRTYGALAKRLATLSADEQK